MTHTSLAGSIAHSITYGVYDIYGQKLAGVVNFTTTT